MNDPLSPFIFHHSDHLSIDQVLDSKLHRLHFWKLAQSSDIALTFDARITSPHRVPISIVGQRFYESLAAGCVLAGSRPETDEWSELFDWKDSLIELPHDCSEAVEELITILADRNRVASIRERNLKEVQARHDWRHRIPHIFSGFVQL
jgi:hypothetical protein